jgi:pentatricopeptide repeat protein
LQTGHSLKLCTVIDYLNQQGRVDEAEKLLNRVLFHFGEVYPKETLLQTPIHDLIGITDVFNAIYPSVTQQPPQTKTGLDAYAESLRQQGFTVIKGVNYRGKHPA